MVAGGGVLAWLGFSMLRGLAPEPPGAAKPEEFFWGPTPSSKEELI
jgi:threonine/homoserine/homoserine lactone efflux protein